jgi:hypothetical protein
VRTNSKQKWSEIIENQKSSSKTAREWCKDQEISYQSFIHWRKRLSQCEEKKTPFIEMAEESTWIEIHLEGATIRITKNFDRGALLFCLRLLGGH